MVHIATTDFCPVDLNVLLWEYEETLTRWLSVREEPELRDKAQYYAQKAHARRELLLKMFWDEEQGFFFDFNHKKLERSDRWALSALYPLAHGLCSAAQAKRVEQHVASKFLQPGGVVTTWNEGLQSTPHQWDCPNGWAPLQWMTFVGLLNYGLTDTAFAVRERWRSTVEKTFQRTGQVLEKYNVISLDKQGGGGEYECQEGFGWTNGVHLALANLSHWQKIAQLRAALFAPKEVKKSSPNREEVPNEDKEAQRALEASFGDCTTVMYNLA